ncbi:MAG: M1 family aminopeptidase, partial [bacterium]
YGDWTTWMYYMDQSIATYLISFCASNYATFTQTHPDVSIKHFVYPGHLAAAQIDMQRIPEMITTFGSLFGPYPFDSYGNAEAPIFGGGGAMENQTMVTLGNLMITGTGLYEDILAHELAHQWFGDAVGYLDWPEMWLSEGFATYSEGLWHEHRFGFNNYIQYQKQTQTTYFGWESLANAVPIYGPDWEIIWSPLTYEKPASVLHMLRYHVGDVDFFQILQDYFAQFCYGNASTQDFAGVVQSVTGEDYDWFFDQWIFEAGYPIFEYFAVPEPVGGTTDLHLFVSQVQGYNLPDFQTDADLYTFANGDTTIERISIAAQPTQEIIIQLAEEPDSVQLDPLSWILCHKTRRDDLTAPVLEAQEPQITDNGGDGFLDPGESGELSFILVNSGLPTPELDVEVTTEDAQLTITSNTQTIPALGFYEQYDFSATPFEVVNAPASSPRWVEFQIAIREASGGLALDTLWISLPVGTPELLLVDDDGGGNAEINHQTALDGIGRVHRTVEYTSANDLPPLEDYLAVIWACGQQTSNTLTAADQTLIQDYLEAGGSFMLSGRGVVPDLTATGFFQNYLHAQPGGTTTVIVLNGADPLLTGMDFYIVGDGGNQDIVEPDGSAGSAPLLSYYTGQGAAVKYDGNYRSCVLGFGFEDFLSSNPSFNTAQDFLAPVITWLTGTTGITEPPSAVQPADFVVYPCYPNPFNNETVLAFHLPQQSEVRIELFNIAGELLEVLYEGGMDAGYQQIRCCADGWASGLYLYRVKVIDSSGKSSHQQVQKLVLLK